MLKDTRRNMHRSDKAEMRERHAKTAIKNIKNSVFPTHNGILSHVAAFVLTVGFVIYTSSSKKEESTFTKFFATLIRFIHLFGFATWFGVQFWVHVTGFTMHKTLTRNAFFKIQSKIFPMYFMTGVITSAVSLLTHLHINPVGSWEKDRQSFYQTIGLLVSLLCSSLNLSYLGPYTTQLARVRAERLEFLGIKDGVGRVNLDLVKNDETYMEIRKSFMKMHMLCSLVNVLCYGACGINMWCLATKRLSL